MAKPSRQTFFDKIYDRFQSIGIDNDYIKSESVIDDSSIGYLESVLDNNTESDYFPNNDNLYATQSYADKRKFLRRFAAYVEIEDILDKICDDAIIYNTNAKHISLKLNEKYFNDENIKLIHTTFESIYNMHGFAPHKSLLWNQYRKYLIDGVLAYEIVYSYEKNTYAKEMYDKLLSHFTNGNTQPVSFKNTKIPTPEYNKIPKSIIGFRALDPNLLEKHTTTEKGNTYEYYTYKNSNGETSYLTINQVVYITYYDDSTSGNISYLERLLRDFNLMRKTEDATVAWQIMNSQVKTKMLIPVGNKTTDKAKAVLRQFTNQFKEDLVVNFDTGEVTVNGRANIQYSKNIALPIRDGSKAEIDTVAGSTINLSDMAIPNYFKSKLREASKIPLQRYNTEGGVVVDYGKDEMDYQELNYFKFILRDLNNFNQIIMKPLLIQIFMDDPLLKFNECENHIQLVPEVNSKFEELKYFKVYEKKLDIIGKFLEKNTDEHIIFSEEWLITKKFELLDDAEMQTNKVYVEQELASRPQSEDIE